MEKNELPSLGKIFEDVVRNIPMDSLKTKRDLEPRIWRPDRGKYVLDEEVRGKLLDIADYFIKTMGMDDMGLPSIPVRDVVFTGSLANYNWSRYSDIDIHVRVDLSNVAPTYRELVKEYAEQSKKIFAANQDIRVFEYDVELYMEPVDEPGISLGVYSLTNDAWVKFPDRRTEALDFGTIRKKTLAVMNATDAIGRSIDSGMVNTDKALDELKGLWRRVKNMRRLGLERDGEFSVENLVFKLLRRNEYIAKIIDMRADLVDKKLSYDNKGIHSQ